MSCRNRARSDYFLTEPPLHLCPTGCFPSFDPVVGTLLAFFAAGVVVRPLGAAVFGHLGDRRGRRLALIITVTLIGLSTGLIGLFPIYDAIGAPPHLAHRAAVLQGVSVGGEWGGATLIALEYAPAHRRD